MILGQTYRIYDSSRYLDGGNLRRRRGEHPMAALAAQSDDIVAAFIEECKEHDSRSRYGHLEKAGVPTELRCAPPHGQALTRLGGEFRADGIRLRRGNVSAGHDQRDWEFAKKYGIDVVQVVEPAGEDPCDLESAAFTDKGRLVNSGEFDGKLSDEAFAAIVEALEAKGSGRSVTNYRLRDWGVSRQRYWGCPIPVIHCDSCGVQPVPEADLPVVLPTEVTFEGVSSPLNKMENFLKCPARSAERRHDAKQTPSTPLWNRLGTLRDLHPGCACHGG